MTETATADTGAGTPPTPSPAEKTPQAQAPAAKQETSAEAKPATPPAESGYKIPDAYKEKPWAAKIKTEDDLWKQVDNLQTVVGKKTVVPDFKAATPKEINEYFDQLRPADKAEYKFSDETPEEMRPVYADLLHKHGLSTYQAENLAKDFNAMLATRAASENSQDGFATNMKKSFGDKFEEPVATLRKTMNQNLNAEDKVLLDGKFNNEQLGVVFRLVDKLTKNYGIKESGAQVEGGEVTPQVPDLEKKASDILKEIQDIKKRPHTNAEVQAKINERQKIFETIAKNKK